MRRALILLSLMALAACGRQDAGSPVDTVYIAPGEDLFANGLRLGPAAQSLRAARWQGLVRLDAQGEVVPGMAERWIVTDDGLSYIFRLSTPPTGEDHELSARTVARDLNRAIRACLLYTSDAADE